MPAGLGEAGTNSDVASLVEFWEGITLQILSDLLDIIAAPEEGNLHLLIPPR